jgi:hypothetical protein
MRSRADFVCLVLRALSASEVGFGSFPDGTHPSAPRQVYLNKRTLSRELVQGFLDAEAIGIQ